MHRNDTTENICGRNPLLVGAQLLGKKPRKLFIYQSVLSYMLIFYSHAVTLNSFDLINTFKTANLQRYCVHKKYLW